MQRREFITLLGGATTWSRAAHAQQVERARRIGVLMPYSNDPTAQARLAKFKEELGALGWKEGGNVQIDYYFANSNIGLMRTYAANLVASAPDVIFAAAPPVLAALNNETRSIPIVFANITDPVGVGLVQSLGHPGGNVTGFGAYDFSVAGKWVELLTQAAPSLVRVGVVQMPQHVTNAKLFKAAQAVAISMKLEPLEIGVRTPAEIERAVGEIAGKPDSGLVVLPNPVTTDHHELIVQLAARYKVPAIYPYRDLAQGGGLMSYGPNVADDYKNAAAYVDRILKGEKPANLPVQAPSKFELMIDLKAAKAIGLVVPPMLIATADEVIE